MHQHISSRVHLGAFFVEESNAKKLQCRAKAIKLVVVWSCSFCNSADPEWENE